MRLSDRELLQLAAKAAEFRIHGWIGEKFYVINAPNPAEHYDPFPWAPLEDDGQALRLAIKLRLDIMPGEHDQEASTRDYTVVATEFNGDDPYAACRRAIVCAAAEIARSQAQ